MLPVSAITRLHFAIHHRCTCKWDWTEMLFLTCWEQRLVNSASYEYRKMSARRGAQFVPIGMPTVCWKTSGIYPKIVSTRNSSILMMSSSEYLFFRIGVLLHKICFVMPLYQIFVSMVTIFENEGVSDIWLPFLKMKAFRIILESLFFSISGDVWLYKAWKNQKTWCLLHGWKLEI